MMMEDGALKLCDFGAAVAIDPATGRVAAMPAEICDLENQFAEQLGGPAPPSMAAMTPYSLRKVTQVRRALCSGGTQCRDETLRAGPEGRGRAVQGTDVYNAPERSNKSDMRKVDVWAIGCVLYELCSGGQRLFRWSSEQQKYMQLSQLFSGSWTPPPLPANAAGWQEVIDAMLTVEPALRPLPSDVLKLGIFGCAFGLYACASVLPTFARPRILQASTPPRRRCLPSARLRGRRACRAELRCDAASLASTRAWSWHVRRGTQPGPRACRKMYFRHTGASAGTGRVRRSLVLPARLNAVVPCQQEAVKGAVAKLDELETAVTL